MVELFERANVGFSKPGEPLKKRLTYNEYWYGSSGFLEARMPFMELRIELRLDDGMVFLATCQTSEDSLSHCKDLKQRQEELEMIAVRTRARMLTDIVGTGIGAAAEEIKNRMQ